MGQVTLSRPLYSCSNGLEGFWLDPPRLHHPSL